MIYSISANVFASKLCPMFGRTIYAKIEANNIDDARALGFDNITNYCNSLYKHHNNKFEFNNLEIKPIE